jgi:hypothetical protein
MQRLCDEEGARSSLHNASEDVCHCRNASRVARNIQRDRLVAIVHALPTTDRRVQAGEVGIRPLMATFLTSA